MLAPRFAVNDVPIDFARRIRLGMTGPTVPRTFAYYERLRPTESTLEFAWKGKVHARSNIAAGWFFSS
jgi:hypothetical protein